MELLEERISQLAGVVSVRVVNNDQGALDEVHVIASQERNPKHIVRDIETLGRVELNQEIDHKKISIAQLGVHNPPPASDRIVLYSVSHFNNQPRCKVELKLGDHLFRADYQGQDDEPVEMLVIRAMIKALAGFLPPDYSLQINNVFRTGLNRELLVVLINLITAASGLRSKMRLAGISYIDDDLPLAAAQAFLQAVNRRLQFFFAPNNCQE